MTIKNSKARCFVKQTTRQSLPWSIYCFSMEGKRQRKRKSRPRGVVGEGMGTAHLFPWHQLNVQCNNSLVCYFPAGRTDLCHLRSVFNLKLFLLQSLKCCFINPSVRSLTSDIFISIRKIRKAAGRNWGEAIPGHRSGPWKLHSCGHRDQGFPKSVGPQTGLPAGPSWDGNQCHGDMTLVMPQHSHSSQLSFITIYTQPSEQGFPYWRVPGNTWHSHSTENRAMEEREDILDKTFWSSSTPTGAHQDRPCESELAPAEPLDS